MNMGMAEGVALAGALCKVLRAKAQPSILETASQEWREEWRRLLGLSGTLKPGKSASQWTRERCQRILPCLPASPQDLPRLAGQLGLTAT
jgi:2-polyprenyl-6-methoxyphenol hydroxylase-like FAD-dependent oxidoreductase